EHQPQALVRQVTGTDFREGGRGRRQRHLERRLHQVEHYAIGVVELERLVLRRGGELEHHARTGVGGGDTDIADFGGDEWRGGSRDQREQHHPNGELLRQKTLRHHGVQRLSCDAIYLFAVKVSILWMRWPPAPMENSNLRCGGGNRPAPLSGHSTSQRYPGSW